ncbi:MAG: hypothetical protein H7256_07210 [Bdellovibrio sp.]|nr:hypothetical protein [Bdellovibrio sp.]
MRNLMPRGFKSSLTVFFISLLLLGFNNCAKFVNFKNNLNEDSFGSSAPGELPSFNLTSVKTTSSAPFVMGHGFKKGDVPQTTGIQVNGADAQVTVKNRWNDGSVKFAIIAGFANVTANTPLNISLARGTPTTGSFILSKQLITSGVTASIGADSIGQVTWSGSDWEAPFQVWILGHRMSSFIFQKAIPGDAHLTAWLEVRVFSNGAVEVLPWIENGYLKVNNVTNKNALYSFTLNGQQKFNLAINLPHHSRTPLIDGPELGYWLQTDPQIIPSHDVAYFQKTELVPTYASRTPAINIVDRTPKFSPLQQGNFTYDSDSMASSGYQAPIGLLPTHDVNYLTCTEIGCPVYNAVVRNGFGAGRYPIHYRDENTKRPLKFSNYPELVIADGCGFKDSGGAYEYTPPCGGTKGPPGWDVAHSPSVGYMAYLLTGRWYFMEEVQFAATTNFLGLVAGDVMRHHTDGIFHPVPGAFQTRSAAWAIRTLAQALTVTADDDTSLRSEFKRSMEANINFYHSMYVAQSNNPFGIIQPAESYGQGYKTVAIWQQDFVTAAWGYSLALDLPVSSDHLKKQNEFFQWKAKSIVGRLGLQTDFWYVNASSYTMAISNAELPDFEKGTGPWLASWNEIYKTTFSTPPSYLTNTEGVLAGEYTIDSWARSMWGNIHPAIAYSVRFRVPGAVDAYNRMKNASNYKEMASYFSGAPVWNVAPAK